MDLKNAILIDSMSGTVVNPRYCYLVPSASLTDEEWDNLNDASDSEISTLAKEHGICLTQNENVLDQIEECLSQEFSSDTFNKIADLIRSTGRTITEPETN